VPTCLIRWHDGLHVVWGEGELVAEEEGADEGEFLKLLQADGLLQQLPLGLQREELVDELLGVGEEVVVVILVPLQALEEFSQQSVKKYR
jgi:hypothetical protein